MAEKTILVCDVCGMPAFTQRPVDVCKEHSRTPILKVVTVGGHEEAEAQNRIRFRPVTCNRCGREFKGGQGAANHCQTEHGWKPGQKKMWTLVT